MVAEFYDSSAFTKLFLMNLAVNSLGRAMQTLIYELSAVSQSQR